MPHLPGLPPYRLLAIHTCHTCPSNNTHHTSPSYSTYLGSYAFKQCTCTDTGCCSKCELTVYRPFLRCWSCGFTNGVEEMEADAWQETVPVYGNGRGEGEGGETAMSRCLECGMAPDSSWVLVWQVAKYALGVFEWPKGTENSRWCMVMLGWTEDLPSGKRRRRGAVEEGVEVMEKMNLEESLKQLRVSDGLFE